MKKSNKKLVNKKLVNKKLVKNLMVINKELFKNSLSLVGITILFVVLAFVVTINFLKSNVQKTYVDKGFMIQINPKINKELEALTDVEGLNIKANKINITNNNTETKKYQLILTPIDDNDDSIRLLLDNSLLRPLSNFKKENNNYILGEYFVESGYTVLHTVSMWKDKKHEDKKVSVNFNLTVMIID